MVVCEHVFQSFFLNALLPPATKLGQGYIFPGVSDSVHRGGGIPACLAAGGVLSQHALRRRGVPAPRGSAPRGVPGSEGRVHGGDPSSRTATAAGGTHPTGMHSCCMK